MERAAPPCPRCGRPVEAGRSGDVEMLLVRKCPDCRTLPAARRAERNLCPACGRPRPRRARGRGFDFFGVGVAAEAMGTHRPTTGLTCDTCHQPISVHEAVLVSERKLRRRGTKTDPPGVVGGDGHDARGEP